MNSRTTMPKNPAPALCPKLIGLAWLPREWMDMPMLAPFGGVPARAMRQMTVRIAKKNATGIRTTVTTMPSVASPKMKLSIEQPHADPA